MSAVDVVVVSYNSRDRLAACVEPLLGADEIAVIVVDNASPDGSLEAVAGLPLRAIQSGRNGGFSFGCNIGWRAGRGDHVLFLNPDARIEERSVRLLADALDADPGLGAVGPKIIEPDGSIAPSQRRFPRLRSTYAQALFLHRAFPRASWSDELVRGDDRYQQRAEPEWVSGACLMVRRPLLEELGGFDEGFFLYCEDKDLCRRARDAGYGIAFEPAATAIHEGGASAPADIVLPILAASRARYAGKHSGPVASALERLGIALGSLIRIATSRRRYAYARAVRAALLGRRRQVT